MSRLNDVSFYYIIFSIFGSRSPFAQTLSTIAENLLREPDNPKFRQFKSTNTIIKRDLVDPKGTLEYAVAVRRFFFYFYAVCLSSPSLALHVDHVDGFPPRGLTSLFSAAGLVDLYDCALPRSITSNLTTPSTTST